MAIPAAKIFDAACQLALRQRAALIFQSFACHTTESPSRLNMIGAVDGIV
jgi:hypothetical protein